MTPYPTLFPMYDQTDHLYRKMLRVGVPLAAVKQKMSVDKVPQEIVDSILTQHIVTLSTHVQPIAPIAPIAQDCTVTYSIFPYILAQLNAMGAEYIVMKDLAQKLQEIEAQQKRVESQLDAIERLQDESTNPRTMEGLLESSALVVQCFLRTFIARKRIISMKKGRRRGHCGIPARFVSYTNCLQSSTLSHSMRLFAPLKLETENGSQTDPGSGSWHHSTCQEQLPYSTDPFPASV